MKPWLVRLLLVVVLGLVLFLFWMKLSVLPTISDCRALMRDVGVLYLKDKSLAVVPVADYPKSILQLNPKRVFINADGYVRIWISGGGVTSQRGYIVLVTLTEQNAVERLSFLKKKVCDGVFAYEME